VNLFSLSLTYPSDALSYVQQDSVFANTHGG